MVAEPQRLTLATVLACVSWGGVAVPECSVDVLGVDKVVPSTYRKSSLSPGLLFPTGGLSCDRSD